MAGFMGGSAFGMSRDIAGGYIIVTERTFHKMTPGDMGQLTFEIDRTLRELRGSNVVTDDITEVQHRARKIQRLQGALTILRAYQQRRQRRTRV
jgi:hypothetical protein